jgi:ribonuclease HI
MSKNQIKDFIQFLLGSIDNLDYFNYNKNASKEVIRTFLQDCLKKYSSNKKAIIFTDGASRGNPGLAGAGYVILDSNNNTIKSGKKFLGRKTNNEAEYLALKLALEEALNLGFTEIELFLDSELIVKQIKGEYKVNNERLKKHYKEVKELLKKFKHYNINHVKREKNKKADKLANEAIDEKNK